MSHHNCVDIIKPRLLFITTLLFFSFFSLSNGQNSGLDFENQLSCWANLNFDDPLKYQFGGRYIPTIDPFYEFGKNHKLDAELSINTYASFYFHDIKYDTLNSSFKPYRLWLRYSTARLELRLGLQKINFGSAVILRPLMWFDKMDFRDPLQLTDGVYAFLGRYYFNNNTNIWLWTLYGNDNTKGWEIVPSVRNKPEPGGKIQVPLPRGEAAISYHHRVADFSALYAGNPMITKTEYRENLFALDGKWDLGLSYPLNLINNLTFMVYYNWNSK